MKKPIKNFALWLLCFSLLASHLPVKAEEGDTLPEAGPQVGTTAGSPTEESTEPTEDGATEEAAENPSEAETPAETAGLTVEEYLALKNNQADVRRTIDVQTERGAKSETAGDLEEGLLRALRMRRMAENSEMDIVVYRGNSWLNVRSEANVSSPQVGKLYYDDTARVLSRQYTENGVWYHIESGNVNGYVKSEFLLSGYEAAEILSDATTTFATINKDAQRVYRYDNSDSDVLGTIYSGEKYEVDYRTDYFTCIVYKEGEGGRFCGYVPNSSVTLSWELQTGVTIEDERRSLAEMVAIQEELSSKDESRSRSVEESIYARSVAESIAAYNRSVAESKSREAYLESSKARAAYEASRAAAAAADASRAAASAAAARAQASMNYGDYWSMIPAGTSDKRRSIVSNALNYVGKLPYVTGGTSLTTGVDCSGFLKAIYAQYGVPLYHYSYNIARTGVKVPSMDYIRPGDIICYRTWNGGGHVTMFVGYNSAGRPMMVHAPDVGQMVSVTEVYYDGLHTIQNVLWD